MRSRAFVLLTAWCLSVYGASDEKPHLPYYRWGVCPFECCTYRAWKAEGPVTAFTKRDINSPPAFEVKKGEWIRGVGGVVITYRAGLSKILKPVEIGYGKTGDKPLLHLQPGDVVYPLHYQGEGSYLFWYKGQVYSDGVSSDKPDRDPPSAELNIQTITIPQYVWWARIRNKEGATGWTNKLDKFSNVDACG